MKTIKKIVLWTVAAFIVYAIIMSPGQAANMFQSAWNLIMDTAKGLASFFNAILHRN